jgi:hypothetical protein
MNNLAIEHSTINENAKALTEIEEAVNIFRQLAKSNPAAYGNRLFVAEEAVTAAQDLLLAATVAVQTQCK